MNFSDIEVKAGFESKYMEPSVQVVKFSEIKAGLSAQKQTPFIEITAENNTGLTCTTQFYFAEGKNKEISAQAVFTYVAITNGLDISQDADKDKVKSLIGDFDSYDALASKLATLMIGKPFSMVIKGEVVTPTDASKKQWTKGVLSTIVNTVANASKLTFNPEKHIKGTIVSTPTSSSAPEVVVDNSKW